MKPAKPSTDAESQASSSRRAVLAAATEMFAERGYDQVTIRDIAERADLSPAMVMKCGGSKHELFLEAAMVTAPPLPDVPRSDLGEALVREMVQRLVGDAYEPLARALVLRLSAPDPGTVRERFQTGYLAPLTERLGGDDDARRRAEMVVSALMGLAASTRLFDKLSAPSDLEESVTRYGAAVQRIIDG